MNEQNDCIPTMKEGVLSPELNNKIVKLLLLEEKDRTSKLLEKFYYVDTYWISDKKVRIQGYINFIDVPDNLPTWFGEAVENTKIVFKDNKVLFEVWGVIITQELPFLNTTYNEKVIDSAKSTINRYKQFIKDLNKDVDISKAKDTLKFQDTSSCGYCKHFYYKSNSINIEIIKKNNSIICRYCPLDKKREGIGCLEEETLVNMNYAINGIYSTNITKAIKATKARIAFHKRIIKQHS